MEKSKMNAEQKYKSGKSQGIIYRLLQIVNIRAVRWMWPQKAWLLMYEPLADSTPLVSKKSGALAFHFLLQPCIDPSTDSSITPLL